MSGSKAWLTAGLSASCLALLLLVFWVARQSDSIELKPVALRSVGQIGSNTLLPPPPNPWQAAPLHSSPNPVVPLLAGPSSSGRSESAARTTGKFVPWGFLHLKATTAAGRVPPGLTVVLSTCENDTLGDRSVVPRHSATTWGSPYVYETRITMPSSGSLFITQIRPHRRFALSLADGDGNSVREAKRMQLKPFEKIELNMRLSTPAADIQLLVQDMSGAPVIGARIRAGASSSLRMRGVSGPGGWFTLHDYRHDAVDLTVAKEGFGALVRKSVPVPGFGDPITLTLPDELAVTVCLVDLDGRPVRQGWVSAFVAGEILLNKDLVGPAVRSADGDCHLVTGLPPRRITLVAEVAGRRFKQSHDPRVDHAVITIPAHASVTLRWNLPLRAGREHVVRLTERQGNKLLFTRRLLDSEIRASRAEFPVIFQGYYRADVWEIERKGNGQQWHRILQRRPTLIRNGESTEMFLTPR